MATTSSSLRSSSSSWWWWAYQDRPVGSTLAAILIPVVAGVLAAHAIGMASSSSSSSMEMLLLSFSWRELGLVLSNILLLTYIAITIPPKMPVSSRSQDSSTEEELNIQSTEQHDAQKLKQQEQDDKINDDDDDDDDTKDTDGVVVDEKDIIHTIQELRDLMPAGNSHGSTLHDAKKIVHGYLDEQMMAYIQRSPFVQLGTVDHLGRPYISPKGDAPGFVSIIKQHPSPDEDPDQEEKGIGLILPDRPGNRLLFGLQNLLRTGDDDNEDDEDEKQPNPPTKQQRKTTTTTKKKKKNYVSLLFEIPGMNTTLRVGGKNARISTNTKLLHDHMARRCVPKVVILIDIEYAFFHCSKAYMRSRLWTTVAAAASSVSVSCSTEKIIPIATATTNAKNATMNPGNTTAIEDASLVPVKDTEFTVGFGRYFAPKNSFLANVIDNDIDDHYKGVQKAIDGDGKEMEQQ